MNELRIEGWDALVSKLGVVEATRYLLQYQTGSGNYTKFRNDFFENISVGEIITDIHKTYQEQK